MVSELSTLIHNLVLDNPVPAKDLAKAIGKPYSTLLREVNPYDSGAKLGAETLMNIMAQTGDMKPLEYIAAKLGLRLVPLKPPVPVVTPGAFHSNNATTGQNGQSVQGQVEETVCPSCGQVITYALSEAPEEADRTTRL